MSIALNGLTRPAIPAYAAPGPHLPTEVTLYGV